MYKARCVYLPGACFDLRVAIWLPFCNASGVKYREQKRVWVREMLVLGQCRRLGEATLRERRLLFIKSACAEVRLKTHI